MTFWVGDKVAPRVGSRDEGKVVAVFPENGDANIKVGFGGDVYGDYYAEELEVIS